MGIKGLPEVLRPWLKSVQVGKYAGKRAAVDAYSWLHKGAYSCALELGTNNRWWIRQRRDAPYVRYCIHRAQMLRHYGITPVIVFDGDRLPAKGEEKERRERRAECMRKGREEARRPRSRRGDVHVCAGARHHSRHGARVHRRPEARGFRVHRRPV